jgi:hypothetical protein
MYAATIANHFVASRKGSGSSRTQAMGSGNPPIVGIGARGGGTRVGRAILPRVQEQLVPANDEGVDFAACDKVVGLPEPIA